MIHRRYEWFGDGLVDRCSSSFVRASRGCAYDRDLRRRRPGCGDTSRAISVDTQNVGIHCSCGVTASVDVEAQAIDDWWERD